MDKQELFFHIRELKDRLIKSLLAFAIAVGAAYYFADDIYRFLVAPLAEQFSGQPDRKLIYTGLTEAFVTYIKLACYTGFAAAFPIIFYQIYRFVAPGLYSNERVLFLIFLLSSPLLFAGGAALAYYFIFPLAWKFFLSFETPSNAGMPAIELQARVAEYLSLALELMLGFGLCFQMPVILLLLAKMGVVSANTLKKGRRYAIVIIFIVAAIATPPDVLSQISLALPLLALYEISIIGCRWLEPKDNIVIPADDGIQN